MAAIDPKQVILNNKVLVGIYVAALLPIPLWFVLVANGVRGDAERGAGPPGSYGDAKRQLNEAKSLAGGMADKIGNPDDPLFTQTDVERLEKRKQMMEKQLDELRKIVKNADASLEAWFEAFSGLKDGQTPAKAEYDTEWNKQVTKLKEEFKPVLTTDTGENLAYADLPPGGAEQLRVWQKRYWIQEAILQALTDVNKAGAPHEKVRLQARMDFGAGGPKLGDLNLGGADDQKGPPPPYDPIDVRLAVRGPLSRLPIVVRELLARKIPLRVKSIRYENPAGFSMEHQKPRLSIDGKEGYFVQETYFAKVDIEEAKGLDLNDQARWIWEPPVVVELQLEVYDFRKEATEPPAPPAEPAEGEGGEGGEGGG